jgi:small conductance mechanosensitive channel
MPAIHYPTLAAAVIAFALAAVALRIARGLVLRLMGDLDLVPPEYRAAVRARANQLTRALTILAFGIAGLASISLALARFGIGATQWDVRVLANWFVVHGVNVAVILAGAWVLVRAANLAIERLRLRLGRRRLQDDLEWQRRAATLGGVLARLVTVIVGFIAVLMLLREVSIDVGPILTVAGGTAGILAFAVGFGAQNLVRDVISGFFLILEDQVRVGDLARINGVAGSVEQINLRTIVLRDVEGAVQVFPNGTITALANLSKQFSYAIVDLHVAYEEHIDRAIGTAREVGASMQHDPAWGGLIVAPLEVVGVESIDNGLATLRVKFKVLPLHQGRVANELRKRLLATFIGRGIRPYAR